MLRIGIAVFGSRDGTSGGTDIYTRRLVEALANYDTDLTYTILVNSEFVRSWTYQRWPSHISFRPIHSVMPRTLLRRASRRMRGLLGFPMQPHYGPSYLRLQLGQLGLDAIHYPRTLIYPPDPPVPCILTFFDMQHEYLPGFFSPEEVEWRRLNYKSSVERADHLVVPSEYTKQTLVEKYGVVTDRVTLIPVGINPSFGQVSKQEIQVVREKYNLPDKFMFYPANPWPHKNHGRLLAALAQVRQMLDEEPVIVFSGYLRGASGVTTDVVHRLGLEKNVIELGFVPEKELECLYNAATLMVFPSLFEGFGMPLIEAMKCGCPIAVANATAIPECVGDAAYLFDPLNAADIANAIYTLWSDSSLRTKLIEAGYQRVKRYEWQYIVPKLAQVYISSAGRC